jgi:hypothetical protein
VAAGRGILDMFNAFKIMKPEKLTAIPLNPPFKKGEREAKVQGEKVTKEKEYNE